MTWLAIILIFLATASISADDKRKLFLKDKSPSPSVVENISSSSFAWQGRSTRSVTQLGNMIRCNAGCEPLLYKRYGCYCGFKGSGRPVDFIDMCCRNHDWCYSRIPCRPIVTYLLRYGWVCLQPGKAQCSNRVYGNALWNLCAVRLCECDRVFTKCISQFACPTQKATCWSNPIIALASALSRDKTASAERAQ